MGELLLARAMVVDDEAMLVDVPLLVPLRERERVLRLLDDWVDADSLAMRFGPLFLPPRMTNREGEELVLRRTVCELRDDPGEVIASLDATFERQDDTQLWHEMFTIDAIDRSMSSGADPSSSARTGVPQARDSIITSPNGSGQRMGFISAVGGQGDERTAGHCVVRDVDDD